jgi:hypothetical protein
MIRATLLASLASLTGACGGRSGEDETSGESVAAVEADEAAGLQAVRDIRQAQADFLAVNRRYARFISELEEAMMLPVDPEWADSGYSLQLRGTPTADGYSVTANPLEGAAARSFFVDETEVIRMEQGVPATAASPPLEIDPEENPDAP